MLRRETLAAVGQGWSLVETSNNSGDGRRRGQLLFSGLTKP